MTSKYPAHPVQCPYGNHPIFVRPNGSIVAHYADNEMRQRCKGSEETYCDCHLHTQQVCDLCQRVNHTKAFYADKNAVEVLEPGDPRRYTKDRAEAIVYNLSLPGTYASCGDHYYACVRGDEECPACAREKALTCELAALRDAVSPGKCNVGPDYYIRVAQRMRAREMRIIPLESQPLVGDKIE